MNSLGTLSPYKGLIPYSEEDAQFFFGRDQKRAIITDNLMASRLTVLHGASGVGKTSVLRAGVAYQLRKMSQQNIKEGRDPEFAVVVFSSWRDDPVSELAAHVRECVAEVVKGQMLDPLPPSRELAKCLRTWTRLDPSGNKPDVDLLIILDQFEEYFLYHPRETGHGTFAVELPRAVNSADLRANFLISIREDALAKLERFKASIPTLFENRLSLEHLDRQCAREAITKPIVQFNCLYSSERPVSIEPALVEAILEQVKAGEVVLGQSGRGALEDSDDQNVASNEIETPFLQMVLTRLWQEEMSLNSRVLRLDTLERLGGAASIVRKHLDDTMSTLPAKDQDIASRIFYHLVTPSGTKIAHAVRDLADFSELQEEQLDPVLAKLSDTAGRILRPADPPPNQKGVRRYEIFHDVLAPAILDWRARYVQAQKQSVVEREADEQRKRAEQQAAIAKRLQWLTAALVVVCIAAIGAAGYAVRKKLQAEASERFSKANLKKLAEEEAKRESVEAAAKAKSDLFKQESEILKLDREADDLEIQHGHKLALTKFGQLRQLYLNAQTKIGQDAANGDPDAKLLLMEYRLGEANANMAMGKIHGHEGEYDQSLRSYMKALDIKKDELPKNHQDIAPILMAMANAYYELGRYGDSLENIKTAIDIYRQNRFSSQKPPLKDAVDLLTKLRARNP